MGREPRRAESSTRASSAQFARIVVAKRLRRFGRLSLRSKRIRSLPGSDRRPSFLRRGLELRLVSRRHSFFHRPAHAAEGCMIQYSHSRFTIRTRRERRAPSAGKSPAGISLFRARQSPFLQARITREHSPQKSRKAPRPGHSKESTGRQQEGGAARKPRC